MNLFKILESRLGVGSWLGVWAKYNFTENTYPLKDSNFHDDHLVESEMRELKTHPWCFSFGVAKILQVWKKFKAGITETKDR